MKRRLALALSLAAMMAVGGFHSASAAELATTRAPFETLRLSAELARLGRLNRDPWSLALAARLRRSAPVTPVTRAPEGDGAIEAAGDPAEGWLEEAERLGGEDPRLASLIEEVRRTATKGRSGGPQLSRAKIGPRGSHRYGARFEGGRPAVVYVEGDGDTDLALAVRGPAGVACSDTGPGDLKLCAWTATPGGTYSVEVTNRGAVANAYALATN